MSYEQKLLQMKKLVKKTTAKKQTTSTLQKITAPPAPFYEKQWLAAGLEKEENDFGLVYKRIVTYTDHYLHGHYKLSALQQTMQIWQEEAQPHPLAPHPQKPLLFFDTETTGLKGSGTHIFLIGFLQRVADHFRLTQYILPNPDHETAFLYATRLWEQAFTLVTYNGKSFDFPLVLSRWTMNRTHLPPIHNHSIVDLLHGSRRLWKQELDSFKLSHIEKEQLGFHRKGDIPGHLAPIIYKDAIQSGNFDYLMKVLQHNEWDILSLITLYVHATALLLNTESDASPTESTNVGKWFADLKQFDRSQAVLERVVATYGNAHPEAFYHFGYAMKRVGEVQNAIAAFRVAADALTGRTQVIALEELAKLYEHKTKDLALALQVTKQAQRLLERQDFITERFQNRMEIALKKREIRLRSKIFPGQAQDVTN